jgi:hypothetical protein
MVGVGSAFNIQDRKNIQNITTVVMVDGMPIAYDYAVTNLTMENLTIKNTFN